MSQSEALQSYTPTERGPLRYDSLTAREGCEPISGNDFLGWRAYERICVFRHDATNPLFNQPDTVSYSLGPTTPGNGTGTGAYGVRIEENEDIEVLNLKSLTVANGATRLWGYFASYEEQEDGHVNAEIGLGPTPFDRAFWAEGLSALPPPITQIEFGQIGPHYAGNGVTIRVVFKFPALARGQFSLVVDRPNKPWNTLWTVWVATAGIRTGKVGIVVPPADGLGSQSGLYPDTTPKKVAHAWNQNALLSIAIQKTASLIEIKRYTTTNSAEGGNPVTHVFSGRSPVMFNTGTLDTSIKTKSGNVVLYLKPERPTVLFGRFEKDTTPYGVERVLMPDMRVIPSRLISVRDEGRRQVLRFIDVDGRDVSLTSPVYVVDATGDDKASLLVALAGGEAYQNAIFQDAGIEKAKLTVAMAGGYVYDAIVSTPDLPIDAGSVSVALAGGEVETP